MPCAAAAQEQRSTPSARMERPKLTFLKQRVIEAIVLSGREEQSFLAGHAAEQASVGMTSGELLDPFLVLLPENRAGRVEQFTTRAQHLPQRVEQPRLLLGKACHIRRPPQPSDVRVPSDHARRRARRVDQHPIEGLAVPPRCEFAGVGAERSGAQPEAAEVFVHPFEPLRVEVEGDKLHVGKLENVRGLASWRCTGVQHTLARRQIEQGCGELCTCILYGYPTLAEAG